MIKYVIVTLLYLAALGVSWKESDSRPTSRRTVWISSGILVVGCVWMLYSITALRVFSPLEALEAWLLRIPGMNTWLHE